MVDLKKRLYDMFLKDLLKQAQAGTPVEAMGFVSHDPNAPAMPTIDHQHRKPRPQWLEDELDLEGWEPLS